MKTKSRALAITAASIYILAAIYEFLIMINYINTARTFGSGTRFRYYTTYYGWLTMQAVLVLSGLIVLIIALFLRRKVTLGAVGFMIMAFSGFARVIASVSLMEYYDNNFFFIELSAAFVLYIVPFAFSAIMLFALAKHEAERKSLRKCWMIGPILYTVYLIYSIYGNIATFRYLTVVTMIGWLIQILFVAAYYLANLWLAYANAEIMDATQPAYQQPVYQQPVQQPMYQQPVYQQPVPQQAVYQQPVYQQPVPQQPVYAQQQQPVQAAYQQMPQQPVQPVYQQMPQQPAYQQQVQPVQIIQPTQDVTTAPAQPNGSNQ